MFEWTQRLLIGHTHKWEIVEIINIKHYDIDSIAMKIIVSRCSICGKLKNHKITWG